MMRRHIPFDYGDSASFVAAARAIPMLTREQEQMLARRWREFEDPRAAQELVASHVKFAIKMARKFRGYGLPMSDLIQEANIGLMDAVERFDPERGFRFATCAQWWVRASIQEYVMNTLSIVKMSSMTTFKKAFFNLRKAKRFIGVDYEGDLKPEHLERIAYLLGISEATVFNANRRLQGDSSLNEKMTESHDGAEWLERIDVLQDEAPDMETLIIEDEEGENRLKAMQDSLKVLNPRERRIFEARRLLEEPKTLQELADELGISRERIRQLEVRAFEKVKARTRHLLGKRLRDKRYTTKKRSKSELIDA